jgi:serine phosphatase RsbU (regulator of sigma subunit)
VDGQRDRRFDLLVRTSHALDVRLDPEVVLRTLVELLVPDFVDACEISLVTGNVFDRIVAAVGAGDQLIKRREQLVLGVDADHPIANVVRTGEAIFVDLDSPDADFYFGPPDTPLTARAAGINSIAIVPLTGRRTVLGAFSVGMGRSGRRLESDDLETLSVVGRRVAANVENAQLYDRVRRQAHTLQRALLPNELPTADWFDVAGRYRPGTDGDEVGGDWYDAHQSDSGELTFTIGDVEGRGLEAAAVMGQLRSAVATLELEGHGPVAILDRLDRVRTRAGSLATVLCGSLATDGRLRYASAGHLPPLLITPAGASLLPVQPGPPVGMDSRLQPKLHEHFLARGDAVVLFTDGLIERRGVSIDVGFDDMRRAASGLAGAQANQVADRLLESLVREATGDDVALLAIRFRGPSDLS